MAQDNAFFSKDYIEHLRSVHFTLVGVSIILGFLAFSPAPSQYEEAKNQLVGIQRLDRAEVGNMVNHEYQQALRSWNHSDSVTLLATDATVMIVPDLNRSFNISFKPLTQGFARPIPEILGFDPSEPLDEPMDPHSFSIVDRISQILGLIVCAWLDCFADVVANYGLHRAFSPHGNTSI